MAVSRHLSPLFTIGESATVVRRAHLHWAENREQLLCRLSLGNESICHCVREKGKRCCYCCCYLCIKGDLGGAEEKRKIPTPPCFFIQLAHVSYFLPLFPGMCFHHQHFLHSNSIYCCHVARPLVSYHNVALEAANRVCPACPDLAIRYLPNSSQCYRFKPIN